MDPTLISAGISAVGTLFKGIGDFFNGNNQAEAERNAARQANAEAAVAAGQAIGQGEDAVAAGATRAAANGGGLGGSSLAVLQNLAERAMFNARAAVYRGQTEAEQHFYQARVAQHDGLMNLISSLPSGAAQIYGGMGKSAALKRIGSLGGQGGLGGGGGGLTAETGADASALSELEGLF